ncbi:MAG TPA: flavin reductase family protein [Rhodanobacteraceae bacterium]
MSPVAPVARAIDPELFRRVLGRFATGVTVVSFMRAGKPAGMTVNAFLSVSLDPPLVLVSVRKGSRFVRHVHPGDRCGISILAEQQRALGPHFANHTAQTSGVLFADFAGTPVLDGSLAQIVARVVEIHPAGDHLLFIAAIEHLRHGPEAQPLIFFSGRYKEVHAHAPATRDGEPAG